ncbi:MAG: amidohydrolase family protein [Dehalococcoidia bacterium]|nr:MAG: amidohydrolase family protein [Dehalococcoidia bacterium]
MIENDHIAQVGKDKAVEVPQGARVFELDGRTVMPGLSDAHVHLGIVHLSVGEAQRESLAVWAMKVRQVIKDTLEMGFTSVRDAGGIDGGFAQAVAEGYIRGPRILPSGSPISQTGGHGDWRQRFQEGPLQAIPGLLAMPAICDGPEEVRKAARQQLRRGATQLKVMAAGGAMSPADELNTTQLTVEEMAAAVYEAAAVGKIVMAHTYSPRSIANALEAGVRSIEHGNFLDEATAAKMKDQGAFLVPTLTTYELIVQFGEQYGVPKFNLEKTREAKSGSLDSVQVATAAGVKIGSGSDLLAAMQPYKTMELSLKAQVMGPMAAIVSATRTNAELFGLADKLGTVEAGKWADIIVVDGNPADDIERLRDKNNVKLVLKQGAVLKNLLEA